MIERIVELFGELAERLHTEDGQDMIEYSLLTGFIALAAIAAVVLVGPFLQNTFRAIVTALPS